MRTIFIILILVLTIAIGCGKKKEEEKPPELPNQEEAEQPKKKISPLLGKPGKVMIDDKEQDYESN